MRKTSAPLGIVIISISQLVASVSFFYFRQRVRRCTRGYCPGWSNLSVGSILLRAHL